MNVSRADPLPAPARADPASTRSSIAALLTAGIDRPYVIGLSDALTAVGSRLDVVGSDDLAVSELLTNPRVRFLNLRGDQRPNVPWREKALRLPKYYFNLLRYAATTRTKILHILWNNKFEFLDRIVLLLYYKFMGRKVVFTAHNVNAKKRDLRDSWWNRITLRVQYALCDHIFVHTVKGKRELVDEFGVQEEKATVIPFGINNTLPQSALTRIQARTRLGLSGRDKVLLFFGQIAPYKGLAFLIEALPSLIALDKNYRLIIAGPPKWSGDYWSKVQQTIAENNLEPFLVKSIEHVPDDTVEVYFKAADVLILPYTDIFQSGVLFLGYSFGLPAIATDVGSLREEIVEGETGFICRPQDPGSLAREIGRYFDSELYSALEERREEIKRYANERYSWSKVAEETQRVYARLSAC